MRAQRLFVALTTALTGALALALAAPAQADLFEIDSLTAYGDFRLRAEDDFDSQNADGEERDDRARIRVRLRAGLAYEPNQHWRMEMRLRSGQEGSQQSPHITVLDFDDNETGDASFDLDRWYVRGSVGDFQAWAGRHDLPFWKQDELLLDDDVTMPGISLRYAGAAGPGELALAAGYYSTPVGMTLFSGNLAAGQVAFRPQVGDVRLSLAGGAYVFDADPDNVDGNLLLQGNGSRDYEILAASAQAHWDVRDRPLVLGADLMTNEEDYDPADPDPVTAANFDQTDGFVFLVTWGGLGEARDWLVGYYYANLETFAVNNSYAQDDWVRWGSATQTRSSDMRGHELRFGWAFDSKMNLLARLYLVDAITSVEDGNRFRIDFNYRF